jgi:hypothetical protein
MSVSDMDGLYANLKILGTYPNYRSPSTPLEYATSHTFQDAYLAFAGDPVNWLANVNWDPYRHLGEPDVREFGYAFRHKT